METKNILVSFIAVFAVLALVATVAAASDLTSDAYVKVDGTRVDGKIVSVIAGEYVTVEVLFTSDVNASDVKFKAEIEGEKIDSEDVTAPFDVEAGKFYRKQLTLKVPYELKDEVSDEMVLNVKIDNKDYETEIEDIELRVQRPSYNIGIKSINTVQDAEAGETIPVDVVLKNIGYNDLDDLYVTVSISALGVQRTAYFDDLVAIESSSCCDNDDEDTVNGRIYLEVPNNAKAGIYALEVEVENDDLVASEVAYVSVSNEFSDGSVISTSDGILIVNPTNNLKVYKVISEASEDVTVTVSESVIAIPAGSSKAVKISAQTSSDDAVSYNVNVFSGDELVGSATLAANASSTFTASPAMVLTIILAIVFIVLLIVLFVLIGKKPEKSEEFGESYY